MRNLKKILALVLALVMSLSLMATAGAASFSDVTDGNPYETAIDVLTQLEVIKGFTDGTFQPEGGLTRAQAAALFYRISTGDVKDEYKDNYTYMAGSKFNDLAGAEWARGYINYCQNAKIVIGTSETTFSPQSPVTGYQLMIMMLRTLGYDAYSEFTGKGWELKSASACEAMGLLKNIKNTGDFGAPATRAMTAEILFRGMLQKTVVPNSVANTGYNEEAQTLGQREFGLEGVEGVVIANEWANLNGTSVLAAGTTRMETADGEVATLDVGTGLDAVGLNYTAYIADGGENGTKRSLKLDPVGNTVAFNEGKATSVKDLAKKEGLSYSDADYYINYKENWNDEATSDILIRYVVSEESIKQGQTTEIADKWITYLEKNASKGTVDNTSKVEYTRTMRPDDYITSTDLDIMREIFYSANRLWREIDENNNKYRDGYLEGEVYVGTSSLNDVSDEMSWKKFEETYLDYGRASTYDAAKMGESLRVIDNNGDGKAEYVFKIEYVQDKVVASYKDDLVLNSLKLSDYTGNNLYNPDDIAVNDIVNYDIIDGKLSIWKADVVTGTIETKNFRDVTVTVKGGDTYDQSEITNATSLDENIMMMSDEVKYNMYLDEFGNIRTYEPATAPQYGLLTEIYPTTNQNWNYVTKNTYWAELTYGDEATSEYITGTSDFISDYAWSQRLTKQSNVKLAGDYNYLQPAVAHLGFKTRDNVTAVGKASSDVVSNETWNRDVFLAENYYDAIDHPTWGNFYGAFGYTPRSYTFTNSDGTTRTVNTKDVSFTNVALYTLSEDGESVTLKTASERYVDQRGNNWFYGQDILGNWTKKTAEEWVAYIAANMDGYNEAYNGLDSKLSAKFTTDYTDITNTKDITEANGFYYVYAVDYVQLENNDIRNGNRHFGIDSKYSEFYNTNSNGYVDALDTTEFFIVYPNPQKVVHVVGYNKLPDIDGSTIRATYAVAQNTQSDDRDHDYWTADVIVIEVEKDNTHHNGNVALMYYNPYETSGNVRYLNSLDSAWYSLGAKDPDITVIPENGTKADYDWGNHAWTDEDYGFYDLYNAKDDEGNAKYDAAKDELTVTRSVAIPHGTMGYKDHGIYTGIITRMDRVTQSHYMDVEVYRMPTLGNPNPTLRVTTVNTQWTDTDNDNAIVNVPVYKLVQRGGVTTAVEMLALSDQTASDVKKGDVIIWVGNSFIIDLGSFDELANIPMPIDQTKSVVTVSENPSWLIDLWLDIVEEQTTGLVVGSFPWLVAQAEDLLKGDNMVDPGMSGGLVPDVAAIRAMIKTLKAYDADDDQKVTVESLINRLQAVLDNFADAAEASALREKVLELLAKYVEDKGLNADSELIQKVVAGIYSIGDESVAEDRHEGDGIVIADSIAKFESLMTWDAAHKQPTGLNLDATLEVTIDTEDGEETFVIFDPLKALELQKEILDLLAAYAEEKGIKTDSKAYTDTVKAIEDTTDPEKLEGMLDRTTDADGNVVDTKLDTSNEVFKDLLLENGDPDAIIDDLTDTTGDAEATITDPEASDEDKQAAVENLVDSIEATKAAMEDMTDEQKTEAEAAIAAATAVVTDMAAAFNTAYAAWEAVMADPDATTEAKNAALADVQAEAAKLKDWQVEAVDAVDSSANLAEKIDEVTEAEEIVDPEELTSLTTSVDGVLDYEDGAATLLKDVDFVANGSAVWGFVANGKDTGIKEINLKGKTLTISGMKQGGNTPMGIAVTGDLTINGPGKIVVEKGAGMMLWGKDNTLTVGKDVELVIDNDTDRSQKDIFGIAMVTDSTKQAGTVIFNGKFTGRSFLTIEGTCENTMKVTIGSTAEIHAMSMGLMLQSEHGQTTIRDGAVITSAAGTAIELGGGTLTVNGGRIEADTEEGLIYDDEDRITGDVGGSVTTRGAIVAAPYNGKTTQIYIYGGTIIGATQLALIEPSGKNTEIYAEYNTDGVITKAVETYVAYVVAEGSDKTDVNATRNGWEFGDGSVKDYKTVKWVGED